MVIDVKFQKNEAQKTGSISVTLASSLMKWYYFHFIEDILLGLQPLKKKRLHNVQEQQLVCVWVQLYIHSSQNLTMLCIYSNRMI